MRAARAPVGGARPPWVVLVVVVAVALGFGASPGGPPPTVTQRADAIDALVRCPSCEGISVADSSASTAVAIRHAVAARVRAGQSDGRIDAFLVSRYGPGILLRPPTHGWTAWVWVLPPGALVLAVAGLVVVLWRRRHRGAASVSAEDRALVHEALADRARRRRSVGGARTHVVTRSELEDELSFLLDSLQDLEREHSAGDLSEADFVALRDRYTRRAAEVLRALAARRAVRSVDVRWRHEPQPQLRAGHRHRHRPRHEGAARPCWRQAPSSWWRRWRSPSWCRRPVPDSRARPRRAR